MAAQSMDGNGRKDRSQKNRKTSGCIIRSGSSVNPRVESVPERTENYAAGKMTPEGYLSAAHKRGQHTTLLIASFNSYTF
ncbi:hypothetical protein A9970_08810 [Sphingobacterium sp. UME9]|nr:hypothetical protein [Sphingobacterium sp. UME9]